MKVTKVLLGATCILSLFSCQNETENVRLTIPEAANIELANPDITGEIVDIMLDGDLVQMERVGNLLIFEGDMVFTVNDFPGQLKTEIVGYTTKKRWPNNTMNYTINGSVWHRQADIDWAAAHITNNTDLTLVKGNASNKVKVTSGSGCSSYVGMQGGVQEIKIADGCGRGTIVHEFLHAAGVKHEHTRRDRDNYVTIKWENIQSGKSHNFNKAGSDFSDFTTGMNYGSIMMYPQTAFSKNGNKTIVRNDGQTYSTQRNGLSNKDIQGVNAMY